MSPRPTAAAVRRALAQAYPEAQLVTGGGIFGDDGRTDRREALGDGFEVGSRDITSRYVTVQHHVLGDPGLTTEEGAATALRMLGLYKAVLESRFECDIMGATVPPIDPLPLRLVVTEAWDAPSALEAHLFRPAFTMIDAVADAVAGTDSVEAAAETLEARDLLPRGWLDGDVRSFLVPCSCDGGWGHPDDAPKEFDPDTATREEVKAYQRTWNGRPDTRFKLAVDGIVGSQTLKALKIDEERGSAPTSRAQCGRCAGGFTTSRVPGSVHAIAALAADPEGVRQAEALALEVAARLVPWRGPYPCPDRVQWVVHVGALKPPWGPRSPRDSVLRVYEYLRSVAAEPDDGESPPAARDWSMEDFLREDVVCHAKMRRCRNDGVQVPQRFTTLAPPTGQTSVYADALPDPLEPLLRIWRLGYVLWEVTPTAVVLAALTGQPVPASRRADDFRVR